MKSLSYLVQLRFVIGMLQNKDKFDDYGLSGCKFK